MDVRLDYLDLEPHRPEQAGDERLRAGHSLLEFRVGRDAWEADEFLQFLKGVEHEPTLRHAPVPANPEPAGIDRLNA